MRATRNQPPSWQRGFTLLELMVTVAIVAILTAIAFPNFRDFLKRNAIVGHTSAMVGDLNFARQTASTDLAFVSLCASADTNAAAPTCAASKSYTQGWIVYKAPAAGEAFAGGAGFELLRVEQALSNSSIIADTSAVLSFDQRGRILVDGVAGKPANFLICAKNASGIVGQSRARSAGQRTTVMASGRIATTALSTASDDATAQALCTQ